MDQFLILIIYFTKMTIATNIAQLKNNIKYLAVDKNITIIAVSKKHSVDSIKQVIDCGIKNFGENYLQEAINKIQQINNSDIIWHFIGTIQSNKTALIAQYFHYVHSLDRIKIASHLNNHCQKLNKKLNVFIQINIDNSHTKAGITKEQIPDFLKQMLIFNNLNIKGFMSMPDIKNIDKSFKEMAVLKNKYTQFSQLSMGTSNDMEQAILNDATIIRVGEIIFGKRDK